MALCWLTKVPEEKGISVIYSEVMVNTGGQSRRKLQTNMLPHRFAFWEKLPWIKKSEFPSPQIITLLHPQWAPGAKGTGCLFTYVKLNLKWSRVCTVGLKCQQNPQLKVNGSERWLFVVRRKCSVLTLVMIRLACFEAKRPLKTPLTILFLTAC